MKQSKKADVPSEAGQSGCPHQHFRANTLKRTQLSPAQHLALLATPRGYRWIKALPPNFTGPKPFSLLKSVRKRDENGQNTQYMKEFLSKVLPLMNPEMLYRLKTMLVQEFGMSPREAETFINDQNANAKAKKSRIVQGEDASIKAFWLKEFERMLSAKINDYLISVMCGKLSNRTQAIAENLLQQICDITGEQCKLDNPQNNIQRNQIFLANRIGVWLATLLGKADEEICKEYLKSPRDDMKKKEKKSKKKPTSPVLEAQKVDDGDGKHEEIEEEEKETKGEESKVLEDDRQQEEEEKETIEDQKLLEEVAEKEEEKRNQKDEERKQKEEEMRKKSEEAELNLLETEESQQKIPEVEQQEREEESVKTGGKVEEETTEEKVPKSEERVSEPELKVGEVEKTIEETQDKDEEPLENQEETEQEKTEAQEEMEDARDEIEKPMEKIDDHEEVLDVQEEIQILDKEEENLEDEIEETETKSDEDNKSLLKETEEDENEKITHEPTIEESEPEDALDELADVEPEPTDMSQESDEIEILEESEGELAVVDERKSIEDTTQEEETLAAEKPSSFTELAKESESVEDKQKEEPIRRVPPEGAKRKVYRIKRNVRKCYYNVKEINDKQMSDLTRMARTKKVVLLPEPICDRPTDVKPANNLKDLKEWGEWAANIVNLADKWSSWISKTCVEAEELTQNKTKRGVEYQKKLKEFRKATETHALELKRNKKYAQETSKVWEEKLKKNSA